MIPAVVAKMAHQWRRKRMVGNVGVVVRMAAAVVVLVVAVEAVVRNVVVVTAVTRLVAVVRMVGVGRTAAAIAAHKELPLRLVPHTLLLLWWRWWWRWWR